MLNDIVDSNNNNNVTQIRNYNSSGIISENNSSNINNNVVNVVFEQKPYRYPTNTIFPLKLPKLYIFTKRDARLDKDFKYVELIPKLFTTFFENRSKQINTQSEIYKKYLRLLESANGITNKEEKISLFKNLLKNDLNTLNDTVNRGYIHTDDMQKIIKINLEMISKFLEDRPSIDHTKKLISHLYEGHKRFYHGKFREDMKYGNYFGLMWAKNDQHLKELIAETTRSEGKLSNSNQLLVYFTPLEKFLEYINTIHKTYDFKSPLLYVNDSWSYGVIDEDTIILNRFDDGTLDINDFLCFVKSKDINTQFELVCQIPLPPDIFGFFLSKKIISGGAKYTHKKNKTKKNKSTKKLNK